MNPCSKKGEHGIFLQKRKNFVSFFCSIIDPMKTRQNQIFANAAPLGLFGFAMTTILLNIQNAGFFSLSVMIMSMGVFCRNPWMATSQWFRCPGFYILWFILADPDFHLGCASCGPDIGWSRFNGMVSHDVGAVHDSTFPVYAKRQYDWKMYFRDACRSVFHAGVRQFHGKPFPAYACRLCRDTVWRVRFLWSFCAYSERTLRADRFTFVVNFRPVVCNPISGMTIPIFRFPFLWRRPWAIVQGLFVFNENGLQARNK